MMRKLIVVTLSTRNYGLPILDVRTGHVIFIHSAGFSTRRCFQCSIHRMINNASDQDLLSNGLHGKQFGFRR